MIAFAIGKWAIGIRRVHGRSDIYGAYNADGIDVECVKMPSWNAAKSWCRSFKQHRGSVTLEE